MKLAKLWIFVVFLEASGEGKILQKVDLIGCVAVAFRENTNYFDLVTKT